MTIISLRKENPTLETLVEMAADGAVIVTHGDKAFAFMPIDQEDVETWQLGENPDFLALMQRSSDRIRKEGAVPLEKARRLLLREKPRKAYSTRRRKS